MGMGDGDGDGDGLKDRGGFEGLSEDQERRRKGGGLILCMEMMGDTHYP